MGEPVYGTISEFAAAYGFTRQEMSRLIGRGEIRLRKRDRGNSVLTETDMVRYVMRRHRNNEKKTRLTGR